MTSILGNQPVRRVGRDLALAALLLLAMAVPGTAQHPVPPAAPSGLAVDMEAPDSLIQAITSDLRTSGDSEHSQGNPWTLQERMEQLGVPAVSVAVVSDGRIHWARAWGIADPENGRPATRHTLFQAASISKAVAGVGALRLVEADLLALDGPVNHHLAGGWRIPEHQWETSAPVTLRHLLTHTGGLTVHGFPGYGPDDPVPALTALLDGEAPANTAPVRVDQEPGTAWRYSGGGTSVLQLAMEEVTGESFADWMAREVLIPAGMTSSTYAQPLPDSLRERAAVAHRTDGSVVRGGWHIYPEQAAAGLWTTPTDLARWILAVQAAAGTPGVEAAPDNRPLLEEATARAMLTEGLGRWGLGLTVQGQGEHHRFSHGGANAGYRAQVVGWVEGSRGIAVMTSSDTGGVVAAELMAAIIRGYGWPEPPGSDD
ncbi:MAG: class A beta-lactamase-related serine hydrolase [Gemmatimonadales bacterium]|nr:MAG: class A beta-lactamase-related serine hydrolase [Gemmatimonadales bacterium]